MPLSYILRRVANELGLDSTNDRTYLLDIINQGAREIYRDRDLPGSLDEVVVKMTPNAQISLPYYIGELRAVREYTSQEKWGINTMRSRYQSPPWNKLWSRWRLKSVSPIQVDLENIGALTFEVQAAEGAIITVNGSTTNSNTSTESTTLSALSTTGTKNWSKIKSISSTSNRVENVTVKDNQGNTLAVLYNDQPETRYHIIDVSQYPQGGDVTSGTQRLMEVLYKKPFTPFYNDSDVFACEGVDDAIVNKALQLWHESKADPGLAAKSLGFAQKVDYLLAKIEENAEGEAERDLAFAPHGMLNLFGSRRDFKRIDRWRYGRI